MAKYKHHILFGKTNYLIVLAGVGLMILGFILMIGGGTDDPSVYPADTLYGFQRTVLAPFLVLLGFVVNGYAIMKKPDIEVETTVTEKKVLYDQPEKTTTKTYKVKGKKGRK